MKGFVFETPFPDEIATKKITNYGDDLLLLDGSSATIQVEGGTTP